MKDKEYLMFKIIHLMLMCATIVLTVIGLIQLMNGPDENLDGAMLIRIISGVVRILAMDVDVLYLVSGYKKRSAIYYKLFFALTMVALILRILIFLTNGASIIMIIGSIVTTILTAVLLFGKDLGRDRSLILLTVTIIIEVIMKLPIGFSDISIAQLGGEFSMFMLLGTAGFMLTAKYIDKSLRGTD